MLNLVFIISIAYDTWTVLQTIKYIDELNMLFTIISKSSNPLPWTRYPWHTKFKNSKLFLEILILIRQHFQKMYLLINNVQ